VKAIKFDDGLIVTMSDRVATTLVATHASSRFDTAQSRALALAHHAIHELARENAARFDHQVADQVDDERTELTTYSRFALRAERCSDGIYVDFDVRPVASTTVDLRAILAADAVARARASKVRSEPLYDDNFIRRPR